MAGTIPPLASIIFDVVPRAALDFVRQRLDEIRAAERVDRVRHAGFVGNDLLRAGRDGCNGFRRRSPGLRPVRWCAEIAFHQERRPWQPGSRCAPRCCRAAAPFSEQPAVLGVEAQRPRARVLRRGSARPLLYARCGARRGCLAISRRKNRCARAKKKESCGTN